jgi:hypothetical protein
MARPTDRMSAGCLRDLCPSSESDGVSAIKYLRRQNSPIPFVNLTISKCAEQPILRLRLVDRLARAAHF